jgi:surface antigen
MPRRSRRPNCRAFPSFGCNGGGYPAQAIRDPYGLSSHPKSRDAETMKATQPAAGKGATHGRSCLPRSAASRAASGYLGLVAIAALVGLIMAGLAPAAASTGAGPSCDAVCAQSIVHEPGKATTFAVRWNRYPYAAQTRREAIDRWGSVERQCTGYAAWALNAMGVDFGMRDRGMNGGTVGFFSARGWARSARRGGWTVSRKPVVGAVAQWRAHETSHWQVRRGRASFTADSHGHVGIVTRVYRDGTVRIRQFDVGAPGRSYSTMRAKAPRYLYVGVS